MKKLLSFSMMVMLLLSTFSVASFAAKPSPIDFVAGTGFYLYDAQGQKTETKDVPEITAVSDGVQVKHGGYYAGGADCGGVITGEKINLNGFKVTVRLDHVPTYDNDDTWFAFDFLAAKRGFYVDNFNPEGGGNTGILNLIRPNKGTLQAMGSDSWTQEGSFTNDVYKFATGDVVTLTVNRTALGGYTFTLEKTGISAPVDVGYEFPVDDIFPDGKAYFSLIASSKKSVADDFVYTITDMVDGTEMTEAERAAIDEAKLEQDADAKREQANGRIELAEKAVTQAKSRAEACGSDGAMTKVNEAQAKVDQAKAAVESGEYTLQQIKDLCSEVTKLVSDANTLCKAAEDAAEKQTTEIETEKTEEQSEAESEAPSDDKKDGFPVWAIALIAGGAVVVVAVVVILTVLRKKK